MDQELIISMHALAMQMIYNSLAYSCNNVEIWEQFFSMHIKLSNFTLPSRIRNYTSKDRVFNKTQYGYTEYLGVSLRHMWNLKGAQWFMRSHAQGMLGIQKKKKNKKERREQGGVESNQ